MLNLSQYARKSGIKYRAAWNRFKAGKIPGAFKDEFGKILVPENVPDKPTKIACYARVSSSQNKSNLESQAQRIVQFANAKGFQVDILVKEIGSGLNDNRRKLNKILEDESITHIIVEHKDRLTRFGFNYIDNWLKSQNRKIIIINQVNSDKEDLLEDLVSIITSFVARIYGLRRSRRQTEKIIQSLSKND